jgi:hypothetical protein
MELHHLAEYRSAKLRVYFLTSPKVRDMQEGAFAAPLSQPIVKAVLLPLVSYGGTWLVQLYALPGL